MVATDGPVIVVGGGIVGTSIAYHLASGERPVVLLERDRLGSGTTGSSIAQFVAHLGPSDSGEHERRRLARDWYDARIADGQLSFEEIGTLRISRTEREFERLKRLKSHGTDVRARSLRPQELAAYGIDPDRVSGGLLTPTDGVLDPGQIVQYMAERARDAGVRIETGTEVTDVRTEDGSVSGVQTNGGTIEGSVVVNAAGPWAPELNDAVGVSAPLRHTEGPIVVLETDRSDPLPLTFLEGGIYLRGEGASKVLAGKFASDYEGATRHDPDHARPVTQSFHLEVADVLERYFPSYGDGKLINEWNGLRTVTPDGRPIVDEAAVDGYVLAAGPSGYGVTLAPAIGRLVAEWFETGGKPALLESLSLGRFESAIEHA